MKIQKKKAKFRRRQTVVIKSGALRGRQYVINEITRIGDDIIYWAGGFRWDADELRPLKAREIVKQLQRGR